MDLPIYQLRINPADDSPSELEYVALVDQPAIERNFIAFSKEGRVKLAADPERRIISGPAMLADTPIYRSACKDTQGQDIPAHYIVFAKDAIEQAVQKFFRKGYNAHFNLMHDQSLVPEGVTVFESFIVDSARGIQPMKGFEDAPEGSWFLSAKVDNEDTWNLIKEGTLLGFSVEGLFQYPTPVQTKAQMWDAFEKSYWALVQAHEDVINKG